MCYVQLCTQKLVLCVLLYTSVVTACLQKINQAINHVYYIISNPLPIVTPLGGRQLTVMRRDKQQLVTNRTHALTHAHWSRPLHRSRSQLSDISRRCAAEVNDHFHLPRLPVISSPYGRHAWPGAESERLKIALESSERDGELGGHRAVLQY